ncbi:ABC transporter substrate-binding protein [Colwellia sp. 12G3]|uniref:ABC transporter substrate-binding protein n=1 Tax=Colwellia sp. 12G3 TaxID=2058299 RepID=UPI001E5D2FEE|nr:ABC transporter substrate-binding protein [Colwellia sp. 12G3]
MLILSLVTLLVCISAILLYLNFESRWQQPKYPVVIAVSKTPLSTPFYVAKAIGAFDGTCVDVEFDEVLGGQRAFAKVMNGDADFGTSSDSVIAFKSLAGRAFVTHAMFVQSDNDVKLISRASAKVNSAIDLQGKKIGVTKGTASEYFLSNLLALEGLTTEDVKLYHYKPEQLMNGFINNEIDAFVPWEPFGFESIQLLADKVKVHQTKGLNTLVFNLISATADTLLVEKAKCLIQGLSIAIDYIASYPTQSKKIVINELNLSAEFIDWVWPDYIFKLGLNQSLVLSVESQAMWAISTQMSQFNEVPNVEHFIDSRAMLQVMPNAVNIPK